MIMQDLMMSLSRVGEASTKNASEKNTFASKRKSERREGSKQGRDKGRKGRRKHGRKEVMKEATLPISGHFGRSGGADPVSLKLDPKSGMH